MPEAASAGRASARSAKAPSADLRQSLRDAGGGDVRLFARRPQSPQPIQRVDRLPPPTLPAPREPVAQLRIVVGERPYPRNYTPPRDWTKGEKALFYRWRDDAEDRKFRSPADLESAIKAAEPREKFEADATHAAGTTHVYTLNANDPMFRSVASSVIADHKARPYTTDALQETRPIMSAVMNPSVGSVFGGLTALLAPVTWFGQEASTRPKMRITKIELLKNPGFRQRFEAARTDIENRLGAGNARETTLYSGHGAVGTAHIVAHGHDPSYGPYHGQKGHGALGRGTYLSDQVDKATSYSSGGQKPGEERSFLMHQALLGDTQDVQERGLYRHRHHNEMVKTARNAANKTIAVGTAATVGEVPNLSTKDSLRGVKSSQPGSGLIGTFVHRKQFDSNEYLIRNADQIYTKFRIYYTLDLGGS